MDRELEEHKQKSKLSEDHMKLLKAELTHRKETRDNMRNLSDFPIAASLPGMYMSVYRASLRINSELCMLSDICRETTVKAKAKMEAEKGAESNGDGFED